MLDSVQRLETSHATHCTPEEYEELYRRSVGQPDEFWLDQAKRLDWSTFPTKAGEWSFDPVDIAWFADGELNLCHNAVDRHLADNGDKTA